MGLSGNIVSRKVITVRGKTDHTIAASGDAQGDTLASEIKRGNAKRAKKGR